MHYIAYLIASINAKCKLCYHPALLESWDAEKEQYFAIQMAYLELSLHIKLGYESFSTAKITHFSFNTLVFTFLHSFNLKVDPNSGAIHLMMPSYYYLTEGTHYPLSKSEASLKSRQEFNRASGPP